MHFSTRPSPKNNTSLAEVTMLRTHYYRKMHKITCGANITRFTVTGATPVSYSEKQCPHLLTHSQSQMSQYLQCLSVISILQPYLHIRSSYPH